MAGSKPSLLRTLVGLPDLCDDGFAGVIWIEEMHPVACRCECRQSGWHTCDRYTRLACLEDVSLVVDAVEKDFVFHRRPRRRPTLRVAPHRVVVVLGMLHVARSAADRGECRHVRNLSCPRRRRRLLGELLIQALRKSVWPSTRLCAIPDFATLTCRTKRSLYMAPAVSGRTKSLAMVNK